MNYPTTVYADTDLVCGEEPKEGHQKYVRCDDNELAADARLASVDAAMERKLKSDEEIESLLAAVNNLVEIVEGVRNVRWNYDGFRLKDTPEWCALYSAWSNQGASVQCFRCHKYFRMPQTMGTDPWPVQCLHCGYMHTSHDGKSAMWPSD